jgi:hypothetical protein
MKTLGNIILFVIVLTGAFLTSFLGVKVVLSVADLYSLSFITQFSFAQIYGAWIVISILNFNYKDKGEKTFDETLIESITKQLNTVLFYLVSWGVAFLAFIILN